MAGTEIFRKRWEELAAGAHFNAGELARLCGVSKRQLQRNFRRCLDRSPQEWLNERRILAAQQLLASGLSIKAVAIELGFKQVSHFHRQFRLLSHLTPLEFVSITANASRVSPSDTQMSPRDSVRPLTG